MLNNISWAGYFYALTIILLVYYAAILLVYYRTEMLQTVNRKWLHQIPDESSTHNSLEETGLHSIQANSFRENTLSEDFSPRAGDNTSQILQTALDELQAYITQAAHKDTCKEELLFSLKSIARKYPMLGSGPLQHSINNLVTVQCKNQCSIHLDVEDVNDLWKW